MSSNSVGLPRSSHGTVATSPFLEISDCTSLTFYASVHVLRLCIVLKHCMILPHTDGPFIAYRHRQDTSSFGSYTSMMRLDDT